MFNQLLKIIALGLIAASVTACSGNKDYMASSFKSAMNNNSQCKAVSTDNTVDIRAASLFETKGKLQISEKNYELQNSIYSEESAKKTIIPAGRKFTLAVDEKCIEQKRLNANENAETVDLTSSIEYLGGSPIENAYQAVELENDVTLADLEDSVENDECIKGVSEVTEVRTAFTVNDPKFAQQKHLAAINASTGWDTFFNQSSGIKNDVIIAVIDTGLDLDHPDLINKLWVNPGEIPNNGIDDDHNGFVDDVNGYDFADHDKDPQAASGNWHGVHVAGLAAAESNNGVGVSGVNGIKVKIMGVKVFGTTGSTSSDIVQNGIQYAIDNGANIINLSLGGLCPGGKSTCSTYQDVLSRAVSRGVVVVTASGNDDTEVIESTACWKNASNQLVCDGQCYGKSTGQSPACVKGFFSPGGFGKDLPGMINIAASDATSGARCGFSNYSSTLVELASPGCDGSTKLLSTIIDSYGYAQGTSMASPVAAGAASLVYGLIWARTGQKPTPATVESVLEAGSRTASAWNGFVLNSKVLDLSTVAQEINTRFPATAPTPTPGPSPTPGGTPNPGDPRCP